MFEFKNGLKTNNKTNNDKLIQFLQEKNYFYTVVFSDEEVVFFEIHLETPCIFRVYFEFGQSISCR